MLAGLKRKQVGSAGIIAEALRNAISSSEIARPPLKQDKIAATFSASHTPVREALKLLVAEGLATLITIADVLYRTCRAASLKS